MSAKKNLKISAKTRKKFELLKKVLLKAQSDLKNLKI
jgi:hypothetical protein